ncbi:uncharacterized protein A1O9_08592 [Exophiala aquamarina CBS 119918]|uniref:Uncharacterized protein n=1 Tax=Exophiala aquamarina CBS 119918 TaxID=1182545 RepID=A0A072P7N2_9EURO|nr:uncharacterized protein A1O9_08592 [Exophiala aquamarina CBS 119918]KEF55841.1 hypothetical protein A1O9_08592 [Exophiala aquamarina CBS 119918]
MVGFKTTFGLLATLAVVGVALPGTAEWSNQGSDATGVAASEHGSSSAAGQDSGNGYSSGTGTGTGAGGGAGGQGQGHGGGTGAEGANGRDGYHGGSHAGGDGEQNLGGSGSDGSHEGGGNSPGTAWRRHENSGGPGGMAGSSSGIQNGNHEDPGSGNDGEHSWDRRRGEGRTVDHEGQGFGVGSGREGKDADRPGGVRPRDDVVDAVKDTFTALTNSSKQRHARDEGDAIKDTFKAVTDTSKQRHPRDEEDAVKDALKALTHTSRQSQARSPEEEEQAKNENDDDGNQSDIDLNEFSRRWQEALDDEDSPDIRFKFDSDHPNAQVTTLRRRAAGLGFYECANRMFTPPCKFTDFVPGQCYERMYHEYGSFSPDRGVNCKLYERTRCNMNHTADNPQASIQWRQLNDIIYPGIPNYQNNTALQLAGFHINGPMSFKCWLALTPVGKSS